MSRAMVVLLWIAMVGCSGATRGPVNAPGQVVVDGDTTFRTRDGNAIEVSTVRRLAAHEATGTATLHGMTLDDARRSQHVRVAAARAWLSIQKALANDPATAYEAARKGIEELGTDYRGASRDGKHVVDDTGSSLRLAGMAAAQGDLARAAQETGAVLTLRVDTYLRVFAPSVE